MSFARADPWDHDDRVGIHGRPPPSDVLRAPVSRDAATGTWRRSPRSVRMKVVLAHMLAFGIGFGCRWLELPVPAPPTLVGAALVAAITLGYLAADRLA